MKIAYVVYGEILAPVVRSQSLPLLEGLLERGHEPHLIAITSPRRYLRPSAWREPLAAAADVCRGRLHVLTHLPRHAASGLTARRLGRELRKIAPDVVHARQSRAGALVDGTRHPLLLDLRGVRPQEFVLSLGRGEGDLSSREARVLGGLRSADAKARAQASAVVCVSNPFLEHLGGGRETHVIPNPAAPIPVPEAAARAAGRASLGLSETERVWVYSGSLAPWQCAAEAVRLFRAVRRRSPRERLVLLTHDPAGAAALAAREGVAEAVVRSLSPADARAALPLFDVALLLRERHIVNRVSAPVKFAEYLHAGLPVVVTDGVGDASATVGEHGLGVVLWDLDPESGATRVLDGLEVGAGDRCREFARRHLTFDVTVPLYVRAYEDALERFRAGPR